MNIGSGTVQGDGTYRGSLAAHRTTTWTPSVGNPANVAADEDAVRTYPKVYSISDFRVGGRFRSSVIDARLDEHHQHLAQPEPHAAEPVFERRVLSWQGIYLTRGTINITGNVASGGSGVTFVSDGSTITLGGSGNKTLRPFADDLLAFSTRSSSCTGTSGITVNGTGTDPRLAFEGVMYSPNARISISGGVSLRVASGGARRQPRRTRRPAHTAGRSSSA